MEKAMEMLDLGNQISFNKALFDSMAEMTDAVWVFNVDDNSAIIMHDRISPHMVGKCLSNADCIEWVRRYNHPDEVAKISSCISQEYLKNLRVTEKGNGKVNINGSYHLVKFSVTPSIGADGNVHFVYFTMQDCQEIIEENDQKLKKVNAELKSTRAELNRYLSAVTCGIIQYTKESKKLIFANDIALKILGYSSLEEMQDDGFDGVVKTVYEEDAIQMKFLMESLKTEADAVECEYRVHHKDGREIVCYGNVKLMFNGDDEPIVQRSMIDITDSRRNSLVFKETADTLAGAKMGMWSINLGNGRPKFVMDDVTAAIVGAPVSATPEEAYEFWYDRVDKNFKDKVAECVSEMLSGRNSEVIYPYIHPERGIINIRCGGVIDTDFMGTGKLLRGYHQDITNLDEMLADQIEISNTLQNMFAMVMHIDLERETVKILEDAKGLAATNFGREGRLADLVEFGKQDIAPESITEFEENLNLQSLRMRLGTEKKISFVTKLKYGGMARHSLNASALAENGLVARCVYTIKTIE